MLSVGQNLHARHASLVFVECCAHRVVVLPSLVRLQVQSPDVTLDVAVEHGLPELHSGPNHVLLHAAVRKLSDAGPQFLSDKKGKTTRIRNDFISLCSCG